MTTANPTSDAEVVDCVKSSSRLRIVAGNSKPGPRRGDSCATTLDLSRLQGICEYEPTEYTLTARSGTKLTEIAAALATNGQYIPFDPPFVEQGATLGGALASGLSGPGRVRYGGARDFVLGLRFVDGQGSIVRGGGKVVKNAAGFDFPKLFVGSCGIYGPVLEWTIKVFPHPPAIQSFVASFNRLDEARSAIVALNLRPFDLDAIDLSGDGANQPVSLRVRFAGEAESIRRQLPAVQQTIKAELRELSAMETSQFDRVWDERWNQGSVVRVPTTVESFPVLIKALDAHAMSWRVIGAGQAAWIGVSRETSRAEVSRLLADLKLQGLAIRTEWERGGRLGSAVRSVFGERIKRALDPQGRFGDIES